MRRYRAPLAVGLGLMLFQQVRYGMSPWCCLDCCCPSMSERCPPACSSDHQRSTAQSPRWNCRLRAHTVRDITWAPFPAREPLALCMPSNAITLPCMTRPQITGQPSVLYYSGQILQGAGIDTVQNAARISVGIGAIKLLMTGAAVVTVERVGRKPLLLGGVGAMVASLLVLSAVESGLGGGDSALGPAAAVASLLIYVSAFQASFGPIGWLMVGEVSSEEMMHDEGGGGLVETSSLISASLFHISSLTLSSSLQPQDLSDPGRAAAQGLGPPFSVTDHYPRVASTSTMVHTISTIRIPCPA